MKSVWLLLTVLVLFISGCTALGTSIEKPQQAQELAKKNSLVFGSLTSNSGYAFSLIVRNIQTKHSYSILPPPARKLFSKFSDDNQHGYYFSFLPSGDYIVERISFTNGAFDGSADVHMSFSVAEHSAVYLGALNVDWEVTKNYLIFAKGNLRFAFEDKTDDAYSRLWRRFPALKDELPSRTSLLKINDSVPGPVVPELAPEDIKVQHLHMTSEASK